jgi:hypothetical protein
MEVVMPVLHCDECHHEFEGQFGKKCGWCGAGSYMLAEQTELERFIKDMFPATPPTKDG